MNRCEDYPCCGHTDLDPCARQPYDEPGYFNTHVMCDHENGICDEWEESCDPFNGLCANDDEDCDECAEFWLDFHADAVRDELEG